MQRCSNKEAGSLSPLLMALRPSPCLSSSWLPLVARSLSTFNR